MKNLEIVKRSDEFLEETLGGYGIHWDIVELNSHCCFELFSETNTKSVLVHFSFVKNAFSFKIDADSEWRQIENEDFLLTLFLSQFC